MICTYMCVLRLSEDLLVILQVIIGSLQILRTRSSLLAFVVVVRLSRLAVKN
jgi:hypothetical protein